MKLFYFSMLSFLFQTYPTIPFVHRFCYVSKNVTILITENRFGTKVLGKSISKVVDELKSSIIGKHDYRLERCFVL